MFSRASTGLLLFGLLCAAGAGLYEQGMQAEGSSAIKPAWEHVGPGLAGVMAPVAADPIGRGALYIATMAGGVRRSLDNGETWATVNNGLANLATSALAVDAAGPQSLYVGTVGGGAYKSDDSGESWHPMAGGIQGLIVHPLVADPVRPGVVYAGTLGGSIRKTVDGGNTWPVVFTGNRGIFGIAIDPNDSDAVYFGTVGAGAYKSSNAGVSWTPMPTLTPQVIWTMAVDPADSQILYAGSNEDGVWKSSNGGASWSPVTSAHQLPAIYALAVIPVEAGPSIVFAGTAGAGIWRSVDGGATWRAANGGRRSDDRGRRLRRSLSLSGRIGLSLSTGSASALYAGTDEEAYVSRDLGETWTNVDRRLGGADAFGYAVVVDPAGHRPGNAARHSHAPARVLLSTNEGGLKISSNGGARWNTATGIQSREVRQVAFDPTNANRVYAGSFFAGGILKSVDGGSTWTRHKLGSDIVYVWAVAIDGASPNVVYAGTNGDGLFRSTDYGETWAPLPSGGTSPVVQGVTIDPTDSRRLFVAKANGVYLSENFGATWTQVLGSPSWGITIDERDPSVVFITTKTNGVFRSFDGGRMFAASSVGLGSLTMGRAAKVAIDPRDSRVMYVGTEAHGGGAVYKSYDRGDQWSAANEGIESIGVFALAMDPNEPSVLYVTGREGTYKTTSGGEPRRNERRAAGSLSDDSLAVRYNFIMQLSDIMVSPIGTRSTLRLTEVRR
jgi:photosystem II stability/assembly factor-like uncharacterized protein